MLPEQQEKSLTMEDVKQLIVSLQKDAEQANMPAVQHSMRMQTVQLRLKQLDSYVLTELGEYLEQKQKREQLEANVRALESAKFLKNKALESEDVPK